MAASLVLNRPGPTSRVSAETRQRILLAAARLKYRANQAACALARLRRKRSKSVVVS